MAPIGQGSEGLGVEAVDLHGEQRSYPYKYPYTLFRVGKNCNKLDRT